MVSSQKSRGAWSVHFEGRTEECSKQLIKKPTGVFKQLTSTNQATNGFYMLGMTCEKDV